MNEFDFLNEIIDTALVVIVAAGTVVGVYLVLRALTDELPAMVTTVVITLGSVYVYAIKKKVTKYLDGWMKR